jgi:hypothetical protein
VLESVQLWGQALVTPDMPNLPEEMTPRKSVTPPSGCICGDPNCTIPYGYCHCRCGEKTNPAGKTDHLSGRILGVPVMFRKGHHAKIRPIIEDAKPFKIDGVYCRLIPLSRGLYAIVWESDYKWLMQWKWHAEWSKTIRAFYAVRCVYMDGRVIIIKMHRQILGRESGDKVEVDHIDPWNTLDNRRSNLRTASHAESNWNKRVRRDNKCGLKGVQFSLRHNKWRSRITANGVVYNLGYFNSPIAASEARNAAALRLHGKFARLK